MKKYIIGLVSAICLIGAGCTKFEDYTPSDFGEGPAVEATLEIPENTIGSFKATVKPAEGTTYYSYLLTTETLPKVDPMTLLQADYESTLTVAGFEKAVLVSYAEQQSVEFSLDNQELGTTYYLYAVASNDKGVCGNVAFAELLLPDVEAPHLVNIPSGDTPYKYKATNQGRTVVLEFNEAVARGEGKITYMLADYDAVTYAEGVISNVTINNNMVTITLPEDATFRAQGVSYVFLGFEAGAFTDASGNLSVVMVGGIDDEGGISAPWWEYDPEATGSEVDAMVGTYGFVFVPYDWENQQPGSTDNMRAFDTEFSLKYAHSNDTVVINNFYFTDLKVEGGVYEGGLSIADFYPITVSEMTNNNTGEKLNVMILFAGMPNAEDEEFTEVKFDKSDLGDGTIAFMADRYCGLYLLDYDRMQAGGTWDECNLGWYDLWSPAFFIEGSAFAESSVAPNATLEKGKYTINSKRSVSIAEKARFQNQLKGFSVNRR